MHAIRIALVVFGLILATPALPDESGNNTAQEIAPGILVLPGQLQADHSPDGNSIILRGSEGLTIIDSGRGGEHTTALIRIVKDSGAPLAALINTHWHLDHIGGNARFRQTWPNLHIHAHPSLDAALAGFHADNRKQLELLLPTLARDSPERARYAAELKLLQLDRALAETDRVTGSTTLKLGGRTLDVHVSPHSVTEGDLWIFDPQTKILIAGDLVTLPVPLFDTACPEGWRDALETLSRVDFKLLVPGHGAPMTRPAFESYRSAFGDLLTCSTGAADKHLCIDAWMSDMQASIASADAPYARRLLDYYIEQFIKTGSAGRKRWCADPGSGS
ncbi:MBL fold metallo-hydrolase [Dokdonella sp.]|uniref:MBL fold metallo-hydrolase n=1 Tax=Dokdonella sp. TaxID=2291710 RepID=UPI002BA56D69|nr:MBL fold metallo-hydrolase [Dokdonella sp.]HPN78277.1 MBL fold metallo-hydrolase [Dokdonella sp.]